MCSYLPYYKKFNRTNGELSVNLRICTRFENVIKKIISVSSLQEV